MKKQYQKFDQRPITQPTLDRLLRLLDFSGIDGSTVGTSALPFHKITPGHKCTWVLPSTGCENTDGYLGYEYGIALLCSITFSDEGEDIVDFDPSPIDLGVIHEALSNSQGVLDSCALGFWSVIQGFIDRALNSPRLHAETLLRLREIAHNPNMIRDRCKLVLAGYIPPGILAGGAYE